MRTPDFGWISGQKNAVTSYDYENVMIPTHNRHIDIEDVK